MSPFFTPHGARQNASMGSIQVDEILKLMTFIHFCCFSQLNAINLSCFANHRSFPNLREIRYSGFKSLTCILRKILFQSHQLLSVFSGIKVQLNTLQISP